MSTERSGEAFPVNSALEAFSPIIGTWDTTGTHGMIPDTVLHGRTEFNWHESGAFIVMHSSIQEDVGIPDGVALLSSDDELNTYMFNYYDERGVSRHYEAKIEDGVITWWRNAPSFSQRNTLTIAKDGQSMSSKGEICKDGKTWEQDLDLTYSKVL